MYMFVYVYYNLLEAGYMYVCAYDFMYTSMATIVNSFKTKYSLTDI